MRKALNPLLFILLVTICLIPIICIQDVFAQSKLNLERHTDDYFPLIVGCQYTYKWSYSGRKGTETVFIQRKIVNNVTLYYFLDEDDVIKSNPIIAQDGPGLHAFYIKDGTTTSVILPRGLFVDEFHPSEISGKQIMISQPLYKGKVTKVRSVDGEKEVKFTVKGFESVEVPAGIFPNCVKIRMCETWINKEYEDYITVFWLAPGVGKVKLQNCKGRVEELVSSSIL